MVPVLEALEYFGGYWKYQEGQKYLAELTSGKISDTFVNCGVLTSSPKKYMKKPGVYGVQSLGLGDCAQSLVTSYAHMRGWSIVENMKEFPPYVCGPAFGGITLAYAVAERLFATAIFTEPVIVDGKKGQELKRMIPESYSTVLFVEDVITTGTSTCQMIKAVMEKTVSSVKLEGCVLCLINRSGRDTVQIEGIGEFRIISLAKVEARVWNTFEVAKRECPAVIEALRPKQNWDKLVKGE